MDLVCDSNMLLQSTLVGATFLYSLKHILHPSYPPSVAHQCCGMSARVARTAHTPSTKPGTHPPPPRQHKPRNPQTSTSISRSRRLPPHANQPAALFIPVSNKAKRSTHGGVCSSIRSTFHLYSSRLHSMIQPSRNTGQLCHLPHAYSKPRKSLRIS